MDDWTLFPHDIKNHTTPISKTIFFNISLKNITFRVLKTYKKISFYRGYKMEKHSLYIEKKNLIIHIIGFISSN
jgi:hypothetical protein